MRKCSKMRAVLDFIGVMGAVALLLAVEGAVSQPLSLTSPEVLVLNEPTSDYRTMIPWAEVIRTVQTLVQERQAIGEGPAREDARKMLEAVLSGRFLEERKSQFPIYSALGNSLKSGKLVGDFLRMERHLMGRRGEAIFDSVGPEYHDFLLVYSLYIRIAEYGFERESELLLQLVVKKLLAVNDSIARAKAPETRSAEERSLEGNGPNRKEYLMRAVRFAVENVLKVQTPDRSYSAGEIKAAIRLFAETEKAEEQRLRDSDRHRSRPRTTLRWFLVSTAAYAGMITLISYLASGSSYDSPELAELSESAPLWASVAFTATVSGVLGLFTAMYSRGINNPFWVDLENASAYRLRGAADFCSRLLGNGERPQ